MVESTALEKRQARKSLEGSNPSLSARARENAERLNGSSRERGRDLKAAGGIQDESELVEDECLSPRRGREFLRRNPAQRDEEARNS